MCSSRGRVSRLTIRVPRRGVYIWLESLVALFSINRILLCAIIALGSDISTLRILHSLHSTATRAALHTQRDSNKGLGALDDTPHYWTGQQREGVA
jgi:hypothetical protein